MFPAIKPGDRLRFDRDVGTPQRGDIVSYRADFPGAPEEMVHRVVGLPGEHLEAAPDGRLLVNGAPLVEAYLPAGVATFMPEPVDIPSDHWFMLGDNRERSSDSRVTGPAARANILARVTDVDAVKVTDENDC